MHLYSSHWNWQHPSSPQDKSFPSHRSIHMHRSPAVFSKKTSCSCFVHQPGNRWHTVTLFFHMVFQKKEQEARRPLLTLWNILFQPPDFFNESKLIADHWSFSLRLRRKLRLQQAKAPMSCWFRAQQVAVHTNLLHLNTRNKSLANGNIMASSDFPLPETGNIVPEPHF